MYIDSLELRNTRTFVKRAFEFLHADRAFGPKPGRKHEHHGRHSERRGYLDLPEPRHPNVNLLLGDNGSGKTTVLRAIAYAAMGPAARESGLSERGMIRWNEDEAAFKADFVLHRQDDGMSYPGERLRSAHRLRRRGELELSEFEPNDAARWEPVYESRNDAFFVVGYGATRRVERGESLDMAARTKKSFARAQRVQSLFEDSYSLIPLTFWLPQMKSQNPGRYKQVVNLLNRLLRPGKYELTEEVGRGGDYLFRRGRLKVPFQSLSDGYRAFIGWAGDLLYHVCTGAPSGAKLVESRGIVLVDEIDLHLHPRWQMEVIATVTAALPNMQFVFTSHSPLVAGSLEWMNILTLKTSGTSNQTVVKRLRQSIHGLDADQILLSDFFGLKTTLAPEKRRRLDLLTRRIEEGDNTAPIELIREMSVGTEGEEE